MNQNKKKFQKMGGQCVYCKATDNLSIDHIIPQSLAKTLGLDLNAKENLQVLCQECNVKKGNSLKSNCPTTTRLLKKTFDRWLFLHGTEHSRRKYVWRTLTVKSLNPDPTHLFACDRRCQLELIYQKQKRAHRVSYNLYVGEIPKGKIIMHTCDNRKCVNPEHLKVGTQRENIVDMHQKRRWVDRKRDKHPTAKLKWEDTVRIKRLWAGGLSQREIAKRFNVSQFCIWSITSNKNWTE